MDVFRQSGEAMLQAQEGQREFALMLAAKLRTWFGSFKAWHAAMPVTLPPTESHR